MQTALMLLLWAASATPEVLDLSRKGLEAAPADLCSRGLTGANFCGNNLRVAPPCCSSFRRLYLYRNSIEQLPDDWLAECTHLEELSVSQNALRQLPAHLLSASHSLRRLQASRNHVDSLPPGLLSNATSLRELDLSHNKLTELPHSFLEKTSHLVELFLQANVLRVLPEDLLASCGNLRVLWLSRNRLTRLPKLLLAATPSLRTARFDHNLIGDIAGGAFDHTPQLDFLDLSSNRLTSLPAGLFTKATSLRRLLLADNQLSVVPPAGSLPKNRAFVDLSYNLLQTIADFGTFGASRVVLDNNMWCHDLIPASELSKFDSPERHRWFDQRPVRYDRLHGRVNFTAAGLLNCSAHDVANKDRVTVAADAGIDLNTADTTPTVTVKRTTITESPSPSEGIVPSTTDFMGSKDLEIDTGFVTLDAENTSAATMTGSSSSALIYESTTDGNSSSETTYSESTENTSLESTNTTETNTEATY